MTKRGIFQYFLERFLYPGEYILLYTPGKIQFYWFKIESLFLERY